MRAGAYDWTPLGYADVVSFLFDVEKRSIPATISYMNVELERLYKVANRAKINNGKQRGNSANDGWKGFANIPLTSDDKTAIRNGVLDGNTVLEIIREMLAEGHKVSLTNNIQQNNITASATGSRDDCPNKGYTLTAFANDVTDALAVLAYKHEVVAKRRWDAYHRSEDTDDFG